MANHKKTKLLSGLDKTVGTAIAKNVIRIFFLLISWIFLWIYYGDILFQLQENSLWIFATPEEFETLLLPSDYLTYISRFLLTLFAIKWLGSLFIAIFLALIELLTDFIIGIKIRLYGLSYIPSLILLYILFSTDYDLYYEDENSTFIKILLITSLAIVFIALGVFAIRGRRDRCTSTVSIRAIGQNFIIILLVFCSSFVYASRDSEFIRIASMKYYANQQKWSKVAKLAEKSEKPTKGVAAYHAIALAQMGQIGDRLFRIHHDFKSVSENSSNLKKKFLDGGLLYAPYIYLHCGLIQPSYHYSMEEIVMCGTFKGYLKVMTQAAVISREKKLVDKLLQILSKAPFEGDFVKKYRYFNEHPDAMEKDPILAPIIELKPTQDSFEQVFQTPLYISYYNILSNGSDRALDLALASCLYKKDLNGFSSRCGALIDRNILPKHFQEALVMMCQITNPEILSQFKISHEVYNNVTDFYNELDKYAKTRDKGKEALRERFGKTYMYYNTFENIAKK